MDEEISRVKSVMMPHPYLLQLFQIDHMLRLSLLYSTELQYLRL